MLKDKEQAMTMFDYDLRHYQIADWEAYLFFRKLDCPQSYVLKYEATAGDEFAQRIVALHAVPTVDAVQVERARITTLCLARAAEYKQARDNAYEAVPTCDAVSENEIRQHAVEKLAAEIAAPASPSPAEPRLCLNCEHDNERDPNGCCMAVLRDAGGSLVYCGCKCEFAAAVATCHGCGRTFAPKQSNAAKPAYNCSLACEQTVADLGER